MATMTLVVALFVAAVTLATSCVGCSALLWGGEASGENPGFRMRGADLWHPAEVRVSSDCNAEVERVEYTEGSDAAGAQFVLVGARFEQSASAVVREEPAKIRAIADLQMTQVEYARVTWQGIHDLAAELAPVFKLLALSQFEQTDTGLTVTLPGGLEIGGHRTSDPAELAELFRAASETLETLAPTTQPVE